MNYNDIKWSSYEGRKTNVSYIPKSDCVMEHVNWGPTISIMHFYADGTSQYWNLSNPKIPLPSFRSLVRVHD